MKADAFIGDPNRKPNDILFDQGRLSAAIVDQSACFKSQGPAVSRASQNFERPQR